VVTNGVIGNTSSSISVRASQNRWS
jgi:hypothetical protein